eukprot:gene7307-11626_t
MTIQHQIESAENQTATVALDAPAKELETPSTNPADEIAPEALKVDTTITEVKGDEKIDEKVGNPEQVAPKDEKTAIIESSNASGAPIQEIVSADEKIEKNFAQDTKEESEAALVVPKIKEDSKEKMEESAPKSSEDKKRPLEDEKEESPTKKTKRDSPEQQTVA